jgi:hypothetical protein
LKKKGEMISRELRNIKELKSDEWLAAIKIFSEIDLFNAAAGFTDSS